MNYTPTVAEAVLASHQVWELFLYYLKFGVPRRKGRTADELSRLLMHIATEYVVVAAMNYSASNKDAVDVDVEQEAGINISSFILLILWNKNRLLIECDHGKDEDDSMPLMLEVNTWDQVALSFKDVLLTNQQETLMPGQKRKMGFDPAVVLAGTS
ncbi:hypothetical protein Tco_1144576 [Tanacetum coccineum]